jgi:hypothetical protein
MKDPINCKNRDRKGGHISSGLCSVAWQRAMKRNWIKKLRQRLKKETQVGQDCLSEGNGEAFP